MEGTRLISNDFIMSLNIKAILKNRSTLRLRANETLILWAEGGRCQATCPTVRKKKEYIIACNKRIDSNGRLIFDKNECMLSRWKDEFSDTILVSKILSNKNTLVIGCAVTFSSAHLLIEIMTIAVFKIVIQITTIAIIKTKQLKLLI